jgi:hypothetical protein
MASLWQLKRLSSNEHLARRVRILVPCWSEQSGPDWNMACNGRMIFYTDTDTVVITGGV